MEKRYYCELQHENKETYLKQYLMRGGTYQFCWHKTIELMLVLQGEIEVYVEGELNTLHENDILLINSNFGHSIFSKDVNSITLIIEISPDFFREHKLNYDEFEINCVSTSITRYNAVFSQLRFYMAQIFTYAMKDDIMNEISQKVFTSVLITEIIRNFAIAKEKCGKSKKSNSDATALQSAMDYIDDNFSNKISLEEVAHVARYNRTYLSTLFKKKMGIAFNEYVMRVRLKNAVDCLSNMKKPVLEIALNSGFSDSKTFVQYMKKYCGKTPEKYRIELGNNPDMFRLYGDNRYVEYPNPEAEKRFNYYREGFFYNANNSELYVNKEQVMNQVNIHCNKILEVIDNMF